MPPPDPVPEAKARVVMEQMAAELFRLLGPALGQMYQQTMAAMQSTLSPAGRVVEVKRRRGIEQTTSPQLLAELNDNMEELIAELRKTNELAEESLEDAAPRRRRA
jgi:hypothetical protein